MTLLIFKMKLQVFKTQKFPIYFMMTFWASAWFYSEKNQTSITLNPHWLIKQFIWNLLHKLCYIHTYHQVITHIHTWQYTSQICQLSGMKHLIVCLHELFSVQILFFSANSHSMCNWCPEKHSWELSWWYIQSSFALSEHSNESGHPGTTSSCKFCEDRTSSRRPSTSFLAWWKGTPLIQMHFRLAVVSKFT